VELEKKKIEKEIDGDERKNTEGKARVFEVRIDVNFSSSSKC
jgi:hypothetical protein